MLSKTDILKSDDIKTKKVRVPEWGGDVLVRGLNGAERDAYEQRFYERDKGDKSAMRGWRAWLVAAVVVDKDGKNLFVPADVDALSKKNGEALERIIAVTMKLSGLADDKSAEEN